MMRIQSFSAACCSIAVLLILHSCSGGEQERLTVGKNGNIETIVLENNADEVVHFAASELKEYLEKMTGKELAKST